MGKLQKERLERYKKRLEMYYEAEEAVLLNQEYTIGTKSLKRADLSTIRAAIKVDPNSSWSRFYSITCNSFRIKSACSSVVQTMRPAQSPSSSI